MGDIMNGAVEDEILALTHQLLQAIAAADWSTYQQLCDPGLTAYEPEAGGHLVAGMEFHRFYFEHQAYGPIRTTISSPHIRLLGDDVAVIAYVRLNQRLERDGQPATTAFAETRVWHRKAGGWVHVHFHRSPGAVG